MERRNRAVEALKRLKYIDSLDDEQRALLLEEWVNKYINDLEQKPFYTDLTYPQAVELSELYHKNISFLKKHTVYIKESMDSLKKERKFFN